MITANATKLIYRFGGRTAEGNASMQHELGGKGAGLAEMTRLGIPVPPGFTIHTDVCRYFLKHGKAPESFEEQLTTALEWLEGEQGKRFGDPANPLLVSVRSGAAVSMPGMMDTILNVGMNEACIDGLGGARMQKSFALDCYRRLLQMFGSVVLGIPKGDFERVLTLVSPGAAVAHESLFNEAELLKVISGFHRVIEEQTGSPFPDDYRTQVNLAILAVFDSWKNDRASHYRKIHGIPDNSGTAVTVQSMVFGNSGENSGTGVGFTRNPSTGEKVLYGEFMANAQGEDVVAGTHTPVPLRQLQESMPAVYEQLRSVAEKLELHFRDVQDFEFTVDSGKLFLLQTRSGKRSAQAAVKVSTDMAAEGLISTEEAVLRIAPGAISEVLSPQLDSASIPLTPIASGLAACVGSAVGQIAFTADRAVELAGKQHQNPIILIRHETSADDIHGMSAAVGLVTARGGATSHAAVVARGMGKCCITGVAGLNLDEANGILQLGNLQLREGDWISLDGSTGRIFEGKLPLKAPANNPSLTTLLNWATQLGKPFVRVNADTREDARRGREFGAIGIGLCRTEHMFFAPDRLPQVRSMILANDVDTRQRALDELLPMQQSDFESLFETMAGLPVTIRLIDPPLHEFLPPRDEVVARLSKARADGDQEAEVLELEAILIRSAELHETNPMMGHRGCRLGITYPEIITMQVKAILQAALNIKATGIEVRPEIMVPLVACIEEVRFIRALVDATALAVFEEAGEDIDYLFGTMIELPRAAVCAGSIAAEVDFLSFGTNDLTQMVFGFSRDDSRKYLDSYLELGILQHDPFVTIDRQGVGALMRSAISDARAINPNIKVGVCGEHGGDPASIEFFHSIGVDYVSCSPARVTVAKLAMSQASIASDKNRAPAKSAKIAAFA